MKSGTQKVMKRAGDNGTAELLLERARGSGAEEVGVGQLLQPRKDERHPQESAEQE
jgi:hypothetical protein